MRQFRHEFQVNAPIERVAEFHSSTEALKLLTPPPLYVQFNNLQPLSDGSVADFTLWFGPLPINWVAVHSEVIPLEGFIDTQVNGPFETWIHRHTFHHLDQNTCEVIDEIQAQPGDDLFRGSLSRLIWLNLPLLFAYREWQTRRVVEGL
jgi:ligand-binding SRPBCC domain-containing protein